MKPKQVCALLIVAFAFTSSVSADWRQFIPQSSENGAEIRVMGLHETDDNRIGGNRLNWDDRYLREKFTLYSRGFVYHPRFLQYNFSFGGLLRQEDYSSTLNLPRGWRNTSGLEYNARMLLLPDHPYHAEVFALRLEPLSRQRSTTVLGNLETSWGALFHYRKKPRFFNAKYVEDSISAGESFTHLKTVNAGGAYFKDLGNGKLLTISGQYNRPSFINSLGLTGHSNQYLLDGVIRNQWLSLDSNLSRSSLEQEGSLSGSLGSDQLSFLELLSAHLPANLRSDVRYRHLRNSNEVAGRDSTRTLSSVMNETEITISHKLYESLESSYSFRGGTTDSSGGDSTSVGNFGNVNYNKRTRWGLLLAGLNLGRLGVDSTGQTSVVNESHAAVLVPGSFVLGQSQITDLGTIEVFLKSPLPPNETILLQENIHYSIFVGGGAVQISIFSLPPQFAVPETYDFLVTYSLSSGTFKIQSDTFGFHVSFDYARMLNTYYNYSSTGQDVLSGSFPGLLYNSTITTVGVVFHKRGLRLLGEREKQDWPVSPYRAFRFEARYSDSLTSTFSLSASAEYLNKDYLESVVGTQTAHTDERTSLSLNMQKRLFARSLRFSAGGAYSRFEGLIDGDLISLNSNLTWTIAKLDFALGANVYRSTAAGGGSPEQERTHEYYFLNVGRKLF